MKTHWTDGTILIRPYEPGDIGALHEAALESHHEVGRWLEWCHEDYNLEDATDWVRAQPSAWDRGESFAFAICDAASGAYLGGCGLNALHPLHRFANLGYWVRTGAARRGIASAATRLCARFGFEELDLVRIEIVVATGNAASLGVAEKVGAYREGVLRNRLVCAGRVDDAVMFSLIPEDFE